jgi:hypothetical protein
MSSLSLWGSRSTAMLVLGLAAGGIAPIVISAPARAANFVDVQNHWARPFIEALAEQNIISGYSDQTFRPDQTITRAQLSTILQQAFDENNVKLSKKFDKVTADYWASLDLTNGKSSNGQLRSSDPLSRSQVIVSLAKGLGLNPSGSVTNTLNAYKDASTIPEYAKDSIAAATQQGIVVNYPNVASFNPSKTATRADVAAFIYQALVNEGVLAPISSRMDASKYIAQVSTGNNQVINNGSSTQSVNNNLNTQTSEYRVSQGTTINVGYRVSDKVTVSPGETKPITLIVAQDIRNSQGEILIPKDSQIEGQIVPRYNGSSFLGAQFVAQRLIVGNQSYNDLNATSSLLTTQQTTGGLGGLQRTVGDAAINAAAQVLLGRVTGQGGGVGNILGQGGSIGDILDQVGSIGDILGQSGSVGGILGSVVTGRGSNQQQQNSQIIIDPEKDLQLTLGSDFYVNTISKAPNYSIKTY